MANGNGSGKAGILGGIAVVVITVLASFGITRASWAALNKDVTVACTTLGTTTETTKANAAAIKANAVAIVEMQKQQAAYNATAESIDTRLKRIEDKLDRELK